MRTLFFPLSKNIYELSFRHFQAYFSLEKVLQQKRICVHMEMETVLSHGLGNGLINYLTFFIPLHLMLQR